MSDLTRRFDLSDMKEWETREILTEVYNSLQQKGTTPSTRSVGYILSEDPHLYQPTSNNRPAPSSSQLDRDDCCMELVRLFNSIS